MASAPRRVALTLAASVLLTSCASDTEIDNSNDAIDAVDVELSSERVDMDELFADFGDDTPGCSVAVRLAGGEYIDAHYGMADLDADDPITADTIFDIGSVSKQMTAGAIAILVVDGDVGLDDDIVDHLPELGPFPETIAVSDLVHHTSGLPDYIEFLDAEDDEITTMADALDVIASVDGEPTFSPGTDFEYSNTNYVLLATIIERTTEMTMAEFSTAEIFQPLGMDSTLVRDDQGDLLARQAQGYVEDDEWEPAGSSWRQTGDGAVHSTALDVLAWTELFLGEPFGTGLGSPEWLDIMTTPGPVADGENEYGGGLELVGSGDAFTLGHGGSWIGYGSALVMQPATDTAVAVTCNIDGVDAEGLAASTLAIWSSSN